MACYRPIDCWKSQRLNDNGKRPITFRLSEGYADMHLQVPCGKCDGCLADKSMFWAIRMYHEAQEHDKNCFLTLTYDDKNLPERIQKEELQRFFKRIRNRFDIRYFACGEYGELTNRAHYHAVIFGQNWLDGSISINGELYTNKLIEDVWGKGNISIGSVTMSSCCYVAGYVNKKVGDVDTFAIQSRKPSIGYNWLCKYKDDLIRTGHVVVEGRKLPVPKSYIRSFEEEFLELKAQRAKIFKDLPDDERLSRRDGEYAKALNKKAQLSYRKKQL